MNIPIYQVDAFTDRIFGGNPAAVCPLTDWLEEATMQSIAAENNLAETAFFKKNGADYDLRWFTPKMEVDLCGHATLAAAHVLYEHLNYTAEKVVFHSRSGPLTVQKQGAQYQMNFPVLGPTEGAPELLKKALGVNPLFLGQNIHYYFVEVADEAQLLSIDPDLPTLKQLEKIGVVVSSKGESVDFVSRFFAPKAGIDEDPVTGSAHCALIPYWANRLGKNQLHAYQLSARKGEIFCQLDGDRVHIGGFAKTFLEGALFL